MRMNRMKTASAFLLAVSLILGSSGGLACHAGATDPPSPEKADALTATTFAQHQKQIKPQPGESRWMDVPWLLDLHEARQKAAAEGKPLFIYSSGGATGIGAC